MYTDKGKTLPGARPAKTVHTSRDNTSSFMGKQYKQLSQSPASIGASKKGFTGSGKAGKGKGMPAYNKGNRSKGYC